MSTLSPTASLGAGMYYSITSMPSKRPAYSSDASNEGRVPHKRQRSSTPSCFDSESSDEENEALKVYVVQTKLSPDAITELYTLVNSARTLRLALSSDARDANIIITAIHMRNRLERHVSWNLAQQKAIVTPEWLRDSVKEGHPLPCGKYAAIKVLEQATTENCPDHGDGACEEKCTRNRKPPVGESATGKRISPVVEMTPERVYKNWRARYAVQRAHPLVCPNQGLAEALNVLCRNRELEGLNVNALAYQKAISTIKAFPHRITKERLPEVSKLPALGGKTFFKVQEYITKGKIFEVEETLASERYQALSSFTTVYGIGPARARQFYDMGMRVIQDLERFYGISPPLDDMDPASPESIDAVNGLLEALKTKTSEVIYTPNGKEVPTAKGAGEAPEISIPVALALRRELGVPISRDEVEEIRGVIMRELDDFQPGCISTIVGGYRRGKPKSNDVDIVFTHSDWEHGAEIIKNLCPKFTAELYRKGLVTHVMHLSGFHSNSLRTEHWDTLEKGLTVFRLPETAASGPRIHRRVDLIFAIPSSYWTAVIGWTGSKMFQRDLRLWAKREKGMKFDSNRLTRRHDTKEFLPRSEKEVFNILGLDWVDPTMRNADA